MLMGVAALALVAANSALADTYFFMRDAYIGPLSLIHWVNDGLMAVFFLLVGLEMKREVLDGQLSTWERRRLPGVAAVAGMAVPAIVYAAINLGDPVALRGWAIPAATDIAFALGILALLGRAVPASLKVFLTAVAIIDDMGAVAIIALFYTAQLDFMALGAAFGLLALLAVLNLRGVRSLWAYLIPAPFIWTAMYLSGVHATIAGVLIALAIPLARGPGRPDDVHSPLHRLEHALLKPVSFLVVPAFGFVNAGVSLAGIGPEVLTAGIPLGIIAGLFLGKQIGIMAAVWVAERTGFADLPADATWRQTYGVAILCGIGFTMSLFIGQLAFPGTDGIDDQVKIGVLAGSSLSAVAGSLLLLGAGRRRAARRVSARAS